MFRKPRVTTNNLPVIPAISVWVSSQQRLTAIIVLKLKSYLSIQSDFRGLQQTGRMTPVIKTKGGIMRTGTHFENHQCSISTALKDSEKWIRDNRQLSHRTALPIPGFHHCKLHTPL